MSLTTWFFNADNIGSLGGGKFNFANANTSVFGVLSDGYFPLAQDDRFAGSTLRLLGRFSGISIRGGYPGTVNGNLYEKVYFTGALEFDGGSYVLPTRYTRQRFTVTFPATLKGTLSGYTQSQFGSSTPPIFTSELNMQGTLTLTLQVTGIAPNPNRPLRPLPYYRIRLAKYSFSNTPQNALKSEKAH